MFSGNRVALEGVENAVGELRGELEEQQRQLRTLQHEMQSVMADSMLQWEKVNRAIGRLAKRTEAEATKPDGAAESACLTEDQQNEIIREGGDPWRTRS